MLGSMTTTFLGMKICFVSTSHIISSAPFEHIIVDSQPLILNTSEYNGTVSSEGGTCHSIFRHTFLVPLLMLLFPELPPAGTEWRSCRQEVFEPEDGSDQHTFKDIDNGYL
jgi:hypothetical protein